MATQFFRRFFGCGKCEQIFFYKSITCIGTNCNNNRMLHYVFSLYFFFALFPRLRGSNKRNLNEFLLKKNSTRTHRFLGGLQNVVVLWKKNFSLKKANNKSVEKRMLLVAVHDARMLAYYFCFWHNFPFIFSFVYFILIFFSSKHKRKQKRKSPRNSFQLSVCSHFGWSGEKLIFPYVRMLIDEDTQWEY